MARIKIKKTTTAGKIPQRKRIAMGKAKAPKKARKTV